MDWMKAVKLVDSTAEMWELSLAYMKVEWMVVKMVSMLDELKVGMKVGEWVVLTDWMKAVKLVDSTAELWELSLAYVKVEWMVVKMAAKWV